MRTKIDPARITLDRLSSACPTGGFSCGYEVIDKFFARKSTSHHESFACRVVTAHLDGSAEPIGFFAMSIGSEPDWHFDNDPSILEVITRRFNEKRLVVLHLQWVAVDTKWQRRGVGALLMGRALDDFRQVVDRTGVAALTLKPISNAAAHFYETLGFIAYGQETPRRMFLAAESVML